LSAKNPWGWKTYKQSDGLPSSDVTTLFVDSVGVLWIGTAAGIASFAGDHIKSPRKVPNSLQEPIFGIAEDRHGNLWIATANHILHVKRNSLINGALTETDVREYGLADGLYGTEGVKRYRSVVADSQGHVWFSTNRGLSVANPARAAATSAPALVHIEGVEGDGTQLDLGGPIHFPPGTRRTTFRFVGLSLSNSERVRYRYRLDSFDRGWSEPTTNREATYNNLGVGTYRFRVMASNSDGLWNGSEATVGFEVEPALWQTWWFRFSFILTLALMPWIVYRIRIHQKIAQLNVRFEERLAERTRIAQDLHDTLLQGVLSASMHLHVAGNRLSDDSPAKPLLIQVQQLMNQVINEGRNALQGLRSSSGDPRILEQAFSRIPQELGDHGEVAYRVIVEGSPRPLHPLIRDEVYRIGREALVNAFRHATAASIEIQVEYTAAHLRVAVRDNGCGIDPRVLQGGREGHWGLPGMRERAEKIGGKLKLWSRLNAGTEVELVVPHDVAYQQQSRNGRVSC
ncbi:MAG: hypothetical protein JO347_03825, partial [Candidatus Eremiobacteraeota bacterium]|nr:hypothetical protein [Candidatus Eremiobacteraeota bacterium]